MYMGLHDSWSLHTKVLEAAECCGDTKSPVPFTGYMYRYGFSSHLRS